MTINRGRRAFQFTTCLLGFGCWCAQMAWARDAFVVLSGGDSPFENNYSQYLQARAVAASFVKQYPPNSIWVFFGAGNVEARPPVFGDVLREVQRDGLTLNSWLAGALPHNHAARRDVILRVFRDEILPAVASGGTLYLFVGDHGERARGKDGESLINLWSLERDPASEHGWRSNPDATLGVGELRRILRQGLGKGRVVFCMTQCHAGGFHFLADPRAMTPNPRWFTVAPDWAGKPQPLLARAAGFTATDEFSPAAGCDPAPTSDDWAGYERYLPEKLFGIDLFSLERTGKPLRSFAAAHVAATLEDRTIDKPYATSEQYLERWANLIETRMAKEPNLTGKVKRCLAAYERTLDGAKPKGTDRAFRERQDLFRRFIDAMIQQNPAVRDLLLTGTCQELAAAADGADPAEEPERPDPGQPRRPGRRGGRAATVEARRLWNETVRPAWQSAVEARRADAVPGAAQDFEEYLLGQESKGRDYFFAGGRSRMLREIFWQSGYSDPVSLDPAKAEAIARWGVERRNRILDWARAQIDGSVSAAAEKISQARPRRPRAPVAANPPRRGPEPVRKETAAERVLFYRRVLAAWEFLLAVDERPALNSLRELIELERTPLP